MFQLKRNENPYLWSWHRWRSGQSDPRTRQTNDAPACRPAHFLSARAASRIPCFSVSGWLALPSQVELALRTEI